MIQKIRRKKTKLFEEKIRRNGKNLREHKSNRSSGFMNFSGVMVDFQKEIFASIKEVRLQAKPKQENPNQNKIPTTCSRVMRLWHN